MNWRTLFGRRRRERDLDDEINAHIAIEVQRRIEIGQSAEDARTGALRELRSVSLVKEATRDAWAWRSAERLVQDLRYAFRVLIKNWAHTTVVVLSLALGIGSTTAMFSFVDAVLFKDFDYRNAGELVELRETQGEGRGSNPSPVTYLEWKNLNTVFTHIAAFGEIVNMNVTGSDQAERILGRPVSADYFDMLEARPALGRSFVEGEDQVGRDRVVVLSNRYWRKRFGGDASVIGTKILLDGQARDIVGVLPAGGLFDRLENDVWIPLAIRPEQMRRNTQFFDARARLKPGVTLASAEQEMKHAVDSLIATQPDRKGYGISIVPFRKPARVDIRQATLVLMGTIVVMLLIVGVNVANLLLVRAARRRKEVVIRVAIGAGRLRILRQLLTESVMLSLAGGAAGLWLAHLLVESFVTLLPAGVIPEEVPVGLDLRMALFTAGLSVATGILFGLIPAWQTTKVDLIAGLQSETQGLSARFGELQTRILLVAEVALTCMLVLAAVLMIRSFEKLVNVDPGYQTARILTFKVTPSIQKYPHIPDIVRYEEGLLSRVRALPGVEAASVTDTLPLGDRGTSNSVSIPGKAPDAVRQTPPMFRSVEPGFFSTMGIRLIRGRVLEPRDMDSSVESIVINQSLAKRYWPDADPIGEQINIVKGPGKYQGFQIVGVVADVKQNGLDANARNEIYIPLTQMNEMGFNFFGRSLTFVVRTSGEPLRMAPSIQSLARDLDKDQPLFAIRTMEQVLSYSVSQPRFRTLLFAIFAALGLALAAVGVYGVVSYSAAQRTQEIGIRIALGATPGHVFRSIVGGTMLLTSIGIALGLLGSLGLTHFIQAFLFSVTPADRVTLVVTPAIVIFVAFAGCFIPARRAMKIGPLRAIRHE